MTRLVLAVLSGVLVAAPMPKDKPLTEEEAVARLTGPWRWEVVREESQGQFKAWEPNRVYWHFTTSLAVETIDSGQVEQFPYGYRVDVTTTPMRLDLLYGEGKDANATPGVFRFDGENLIWVRGYLVPEKEAAAVRPDGLSPQKTKRWTKLVLKPVKERPR